MTYHVKTKFTLDVNQSYLGTPNPDEAVHIEPRILSAKWTRNNHHEADVLTVTLGYKECGIDPRQLENAKCSFSIWDSNFEDYNPEKHVRFTGFCKGAERKLGGDAAVVELTFHDYTCLFLDMKPMKPEGLPEWTDSLREAWVKLCNFVGWQDPTNNKIVSTVSIFTRPGGIVFYPEDLQTHLVGKVVTTRFHAISKPSPPSRCDAWAAWRWFVESLGLVTFIDKDVCVVANMNEFYISDGGPRQTPPGVVYGQNIWGFEEKADPKVTSKGILLKSFNPLEGRMIEAFYPKPGDPRLKTRKSAAGKKSDGGAAITANEVSGDYEEYAYNYITEQAALDAKAQASFEERRRQELKGKFKTAEMRLPAADPNESDVDILELRSGAAIYIKVDRESLEVLRNLSSEEERVTYLVDVCGHEKDIARLLAKNSVVAEIQSPKFHVSSIELEYSDQKFEVEVSFHNLILSDV